MYSAAAAAQRVGSVYSNSFLRATSMPIGVARFSGGFSSDGRFLQVGGDTSGTTRTNLCHIGMISTSNPSQITWTQASSNYPTSMAAGASTFLPDGRIVVTGGYDGNYSAATYFGTLGAYGTNTLNWVAGTSIPQARLQHTLNLLNDGRLILIGGYYWNGSVYASIADVHFGTVSNNTITWVAGTSLPEGRGYHGTCILKNGKIIVAGGASGTAPSTGFTSANYRNTVYIGTVSGSTITWVQSSNLPAVANERTSFSGRCSCLALLNSNNQFISFHRRRSVRIGTVSSDSTTIDWSARFSGTQFRNTITKDGESVYEYSKWPDFAYGAGIKEMSPINRRIYAAGLYQDVPAPDYISDPSPGPDLDTSNYPDLGRTDFTQFVSSVIFSNRI